MFSLYRGKLSIAITVIVSIISVGVVYLRLPSLCLAVSQRHGQHQCRPLTHIVTVVESDVLKEERCVHKFTVLVHYGAHAATHANLTLHCGAVCKKYVKGKRARVIISILCTK